MPDANRMYLLNDAIQKHFGYEASHIIMDLP